MSSESSDCDEFAVGAASADAAVATASAAGDLRTDRTARPDLLSARAFRTFEHSNRWRFMKTKKLPRLQCGLLLAAHGESGLSRYRVDRTSYLPRFDPVYS